MRQEERERALKHLKREVRDKAFDEILLFLLNDFEESEKQGRENILEYLQENEVELYCEILYGTMKDSDIFMFNVEPFLSRIHAEGLIFVMEYLENIIEGLDEVAKEEPLILHNSLLMHLLARSFDPDRFIDPSLSPHIDKRLAFLERQGEDPERLSLLRRLLVTDPDAHDLRDMADLAVESVDITINAIKNVQDPVLAKSMLGHQFWLVRLLFTMKDFTRAQEVCRKLMSAFPEDRDVERWFLLSLSMDLRVDDVYKYVSDNYSQEEIDDRPDLLVWVGSMYQKSGEMAKALSNMKRAYELSEGDNSAFFSYVTVLLQSSMYEEAAKLVEDHILSLTEPLTPTVILLLSASFMTVDTATVDRLLVLFEETYPDELENLFISMPIAKNLSYLHVKHRLQTTRGEWTEAARTLERMIMIEPEYPWPSIAMAMLLSMKDKETHDLDKALQKAEESAELVGGSSKGLVGLVYLGSGQLDEAIQSLNESLSLSDEERLFESTEAHRMLSLAYHLSGNSRESCIHAKKWVDLYRERERIKELFSYDATNLMTFALFDRSYIRFVYDNCPEIAHQVEHIIDKWKSREKVVELSFAIQAKDGEIESLRQQVRTLERELTVTKEQYRSLGPVTEDELEPLIDEIARIEGLRVRAQQGLNYTAWEEIDGLLDRSLPGWDKLGDSSRRFIKTAEFGMDTNPREADFSGPIIYYAKAFEAFLHESITETFVKQVRRQYGTILKDWGNISGRMRIVLNKDCSGSLTIGQWARILSPSWEAADKYEHMLKGQVGSLLRGKDMSTLMKHAEHLAQYRNGSAHLDSFSREKAKEVVDHFRKALADAISVLRPCKSENRD